MMMAMTTFRFSLRMHTLLHFGAHEWTWPKAWYGCSNLLDRRWPSLLGALDTHTRNPSGKGPTASEQFLASVMKPQEGKVTCVTRDQQRKSMREREKA